MHELVISKALINAVRASRSRYRSCLQQEKDEEVERENAQKVELKRARDLLDEKIELHKKMKMDSEKLDKEINFLKQKL